MDWFNSLSINTQANIAFWATLLLGYFAGYLVRLGMGCRHARVGYILAREDKDTACILYFCCEPATGFCYTPFMGRAIVFARLYDANRVASGCPYRPFITETTYEVPL